MKKFQPQPGFVVQAYRFALDPNVTQEAALRSHCGAARAAYNWAVSRESGRAGASACPAEIKVQGAARLPVHHRRHPRRA
ncbi:helix-turn-helix domain-containing protein [Nonomuraea wenchangensis]|uniref:helix-turn-helix domain-containing protein n=1 Tax=Nonomuraea wenchangensis TaxID=568860 RepID=UPI0037143881